MPTPLLEGGYSTPYDIHQTYSGSTLNTIGGSGLRVGTRGTLDDRVFRWAKFTSGTAIGPNKLAQMAPPVATHVSESNGAFTAGTTVVDFTPGAGVIAQNQYKDGYIKVEGGTLGIGQMYKLKSHGFKAASTATTFDLYDEVVTTTTGSEVATLLANPWSDIVIQPTTITAPAAGVVLANFAAVTTASVATAGYLQTDTATWTDARYGWVQTWGPVSCLLDTTALVAGSAVIVGAVAGSVGVAVETDIKQRVGIAMEAMTTDNIYASIFLTIAP